MAAPTADKAQNAVAARSLICLPREEIAMDDRMLILYLAIIFGAVVAAIMLSLLVAYVKSPNQILQIVHILAEQGSLIQMAAVVGIVLAVFVLGMLGKLDSAVVSAILSGIAGYVLGDSSKAARLRTSRTAKQPSE